MGTRLIVLLGLVTAVLTVAVGAQTGVAGTWNMTTDTEQGSVSSTLTLTQDGEKLTGEMGPIPDVGTLEFEGTVTGDTVEWVVEIDAGGQFIEITFEGTIDGDEMMGSLDVAGYAGGDWMAKRMP